MSTMSTAKKWDDWGPDWSLDAIALATGESAPPMLSMILVADAAWRKLTKPQRELLLSTAAGAPVLARNDVIRRLRGRGLLDPKNCTELTPAGRAVVQWRLP